MSRMRFLTGQLLLAIWLAGPAAIAATAQDNGLQRVQACNPCLIRPVPDGMPLRLYFGTAKTESGGKRVMSLTIASDDGRASYELPVSAEMDIRPRSDFLIGTPDINFDGFGDLMLIVSQGTANAEAQYWVYDPPARHYSALGVFPVFRIDPTARALSTHTNDGEAGRLFHDATYEWHAVKLVKTSEVVQAWNHERTGVVRSRSVTRNGVLTVMSREIVGR